MSYKTFPSNSYQLNFCWHRIVKSNSNKITIWYNYKMHSWFIYFNICGCLLAISPSVCLAMCTMDTETGCGLPSTGEKTRLLIGTARWFWNSIGWILAAAVRVLAWCVRNTSHSKDSSWRRLKHSLGRGTPLAPRMLSYYTKYEISEL